MEQKFRTHSQQAHTHTQGKSKKKGKLFCYTVTTKDTPREKRTFYVVVVVYKTPFELMAKAREKTVTCGISRI